MGNCLAPNKKRSQVHEFQEEHDSKVNSDKTMKTEETETGDVPTNSDGTDVGTKVKIVLTKEELDWLMYELKVKNKKLEDALAEIERNRAMKSASVNSCWQPSLESISECPEDVGSGRYY
ncbi:unnamed protein product [Linum tenue]|uniref:Uncharacterized protein n=1 Tax=Linum tenue TaxID=586396 RepID=A0AAV0M4K0_9ROSI|nr:unnamed protein product [Linum tenue]